MEEEQQSEGSYEACRERLRTLHQMREWIIKDFSSRKGEVYDFTKPDDELQKYVNNLSFINILEKISLLRPCILFLILSIAANCLRKDSAIQ
jgi:hypothetical protein